MRRTLFFMLLAICFFLKANAQYSIEYTYDDSGNRTHRTIITLPSSITTPSLPDVPIPPVVDQLGERKVEVFPNPTKGKLLVHITGGKIEDVYTFTLYSTTGQQIFEGKRYGQGDYPIEMEQYPSGIYILILKTEGEKLSYKIIKE